MDRYNSDRNSVMRILTQSVPARLILPDVAMMIIQSALERKESRGLHYNLDYPNMDDKNFKRNTVIQRKFAKD